MQFTCLSDATICFFVLILAYLCSVRAVVIVWWGLCTKKHLVRVRKGSVFGLPVLLPQTQLESGRLSRQKYPVVSRLQMVKHHLKLAVLWLGIHQLSRHHHPLHFPTLNTAHMHVMWTWCETYRKGLQKGKTPRFFFWWLGWASSKFAVTKMVKAGHVKKKKKLTCREGSSLYFGVYFWLSKHPRFLSLKW